jgi:hypothetical protein
MKSRVRLALVAGLALVLLPGCAQHYVVKMSNGVQFVTASKPKLKGGSYYFKDAQGTPQSVSQGRVAEIYPASRAKEQKSFFRSGSG